MKIIERCHNTFSNVVPCEVHVYFKKGTIFKEGEKLLHFVNQELGCQIEFSKNKYSEQVVKFEDSSDIEGAPWRIGDLLWVDVMRNLHLAKIA